MLKKMAKKRRLLPSNENNNALSILTEAKFVICNLFLMDISD